ncbi:related to mRNA splicing-associated serine-threonine protein kinase [Ustilago trichophora]|uniref:non-specific serine/threonine protein kinase n=1 Tax=Ustilago trichophora TaxID=86804 RepID=A0A5C3E987_9BASI|nr:related to mRNA splicing-associated serine-threonine protein kinase [Ustilago trichophora]
MSYRHQGSSSSRSHHDRHPARRSDRRSPPASSASLREPASKRPRHDDLKSVLKESHPSSDSFVSRDQRTDAPHSTAAKQDEDSSSNLDSLLDEYDLGIDEEERRRRALEESRRRRQAIMEKHHSSQSATVSDESNAHHASSAPAASSTDPKPSASKPDSGSAVSQTLEAFSLVKSESRKVSQGTAAPDYSARSLERASAAELDPDADRAQELARLDQRRRSSLQKQTAPVTDQEEEYEEVEVTDEEEDAEMDMFALSDDDDNKEDAKKKKTKIIRVPKRGTSKAALLSTTKSAAILDAASALATAANLSSNWDDSEGYLRTILGETLDERYQIFAVLGKGMFASVVRARDLRADGREVAIKIIRVQETMYKAGLKEAAILRKLNDTDPDDRKHVVRLERHFDYKGHLCMVFESLGMNLRDVVRRYGRDVGLNMQAVRAYAHQLFLALSHLAKNSVIHADIKPDNVLVNDSKALLKLCDLGSASYLNEMEITPYLVSRFYRAPEIILGQAYDCSIDVWSTGCTLYELATGKILFPGRTNNHMLLLMQELRGRFTTKQIRKSQFGEQHFDDANAFLSMEPDKSTGQNVVRRVMLQKPVSDLRSRLLPGDAAKQLKGDELKTTNHFVDLLERCLELDPAKRIKPKDALEHPFLAHVKRHA